MDSFFADFSAEAAFDAVVPRELTPIGAPSGKNGEESGPYDFMGSLHKATMGRFRGYYPQNGESHGRTNET